MKILKDYRYILLSFALVFVVNVGLANSTEKENKTENQEQEQEGRRKSDQSMMRPDAESAPDPVELNIQEEDVGEESDSNDTVIYQPVEKLDSAKEETVSKYNFIFYFLYKFKYDGE